MILIHKQNIEGESIQNIYHLNVKNGLWTTISTFKYCRIQRR